ncbi:LPO_1073/Vpar_1526 family protein [Methanocella sp. MCL-LM]|uniref:LPO_1073/Vpar_1526 family protein n=1 Tax=Methanocella sp. MCL-LM TaxID=3412035 RepID=UPI003C78B287
MVNTQSAAKQVPKRISISEATVKRLFSLSGNLCAFPECNQRLVTEDGTILAEICHIEAAMPGGERFNENQTNEERASFDNLILLCPIHHTTTDNVTKYTVEVLKQMKKNHEEKYLTNQYNVTDDIIKKAISLYDSDNVSIINGNQFHTGQGSQTNTVSGSQTIYIMNQGLNLADTKILFQDLFEKNFPQLQDKAKEEAMRNRDKLIQTFYDQAKDELSLEDIQKLSDPDVQYNLICALKSASRKDSQELRDMLSSLIITRIKHDTIDIKRIVLNEATSTLGILTTNQLKILALSFRLKYSRYFRVRSWDDINELLNKHVKPFLDFNTQSIDFAHLEYTSCAKVDVLTWDIIEILKNQYSFFFLNEIESTVVEAMNIPNELKYTIFFFDIPNNKCIFSLLTVHDLDAVIKNKVTPEMHNNLLQLYQKCLKNNDEIEKIMRNKTDIGGELIDKWRSTSLKNLSLTSVGIALGIIYYEHICSEKVNLDIWIH